MEFLFSFAFLLFGLAPLVLLIILFVRTSELSRRLRALEEKSGLTTDKEKQTTPVAPATLPAPVKPAPVPPPARPPEHLEAVIGGKLLNRIGAFALVLAVGFFLKYAFDNEWITETLRVVIGLVVGLGCLAGGARTHTRGYVVFAQGLIGAGIAILYLSLYASFNFYHLIPQWVAFLLMSVVTAGALAQAAWYDSLAVSLLGWAGGFLTPFLLSTGESNEIALFTYTALLALGLLAMTIRKERWFALEPLTLLGTSTVYVAWYSEYGPRGDIGITLFFVALFWLLFHSADLLRMRLGQTGSRPWRHLVQVANAVMVFSAVYVLLEPDFPDALGSATFFIGILYALTLVVSARFATNDEEIEVRYGLIAAGLLFAGTAIEFGNAATIRLWALEGLGLLWIGLRSSRNSYSYASIGFFSFSALMFIVSKGSLAFAPLEEFRLVLNERAANAAVLAGTLGTGAILAARTDSRFARTARPWLGVGAFLVLFVLLTAETNDVFRVKIEDLRRSMAGEGLRAEISQVHNQRHLALSTLWLVYSVAVMAVGIMRGARGPRFLAIGLFGLTILKIFIVDLAFLETLYRIFSFLGLGVILLSVSYLYQRYKTVLFGPDAPERKE